MLACVVFAVVLALSSADLYCGDGTGKGYIYYAPHHSCECNAKSMGALRYHDHHIQFCNGHKYETLVNSGEIDIRIGSKYKPAKSCAHVLEADSNAASGPYYIKTTGEEASKVYCYMAEMCGSRAWTMVMKIDGSKATFNYNSAKWKDKQSYNAEGARGGLDNQETKLPTYHTLAFNKLCLGLKTNGVTKWLRLNYEAQSLYSVIHDGKYRATHLGRDAWKTLVPGSSLQRNCNKEGFNAYHKGSMTRIGIISNQENDCNSPDSRIGFGTAGGYCGQNNANSAGNEARCSADNGDKSIRSFGYIFAQGRVENAPLGSYDNPAPSCSAIKAARSDSKSGVYHLKLGGSVVKGYCFMDMICGAKGWTMIMKVDGNKNTFTYHSAYWTNKATYNTARGLGGLDNQEAKLLSYSAMPFDALCLGMKTGHTTRWLKVPQKASSLYSLIADLKYRPTRLGRDAWKTLVPGSSLQRNCNKEGFNAYHKGSMTRIGIISNQENDCNSPDSRIGFGTAGGYCGQNNANSAGNEARCSADNGNKSIKSFGYIFAQ